MHVISKKTLKDFSEWHPEARNPLEAWFSIMEKTSFRSFADLRRCFNSVDKVGGYCVFNIGGNKFRLIAAIHFNRQKVFIRSILTHEHYDHWRA